MNKRCKNWNGIMASKCKAGHLPSDMVGFVEGCGWLCNSTPNCCLDYTPYQEGELEEEIRAEITEAKQ